MASLKSMTTVGGFTAMSRVLGFLRDVLVARYFGTGPVAEAFFAAFRLPNMFRRIFGEGAFNAAFVPLFGRQLEERGHEEAESFASETLTLMGLVLGIGTLIALPLMRWIMGLLIFGFLKPPGMEFSWEWVWEMVRYPHGTEKFELAVSFGRITFSYLLCMAMAAHLSGVLNTLKIFAMPAFAPVLLNIILLIGLAVVVPLVGASGYVLAWCVCIAGFAQFFSLLITCRMKGIRIRYVRPRRSPLMKRLLILMVPGIISAGVQQLNLFIGTQISSLQDGAVAFIYYADRVNQLPLGMIGIAFGVVLLPDITRKLRSNQMDAAKESLLRGIDYAALITLPAALAMVVIPLPLISVLFERGPFDQESARQTANALMAFALGLPAYVLVRVLQPGYFARENTRAPMRMAVVTVIVNIVFSLALFPSLRHVGIALATSIAGWVNVALLARGLHADRFLSLTREHRKRLFKILAASALMGVAVWGLNRLIAPWFAQGTAVRIGALAVLITAGATVYGAMVLALRATTVSKIRAAFRSS